MNIDPEDDNELPEEEEIPASEQETAPETETPPAESEQDSSVKLSEEFQKKVANLITGASKPELEFIRSSVMEREKELMRAETKGEKSGTFDMGGMPED